MYNRLIENTAPIIKINFSPLEHISYYLIQMWHLDLSSSMQNQ